MTLLACPRDQTPLTDVGGGIHRCSVCHHDYVISVTDAWTAHAGWKPQRPRRRRRVGGVGSDGRRSNHEH